MSARPDTHATISDAVHARLREDILDGVLPPGEKLRIDQVCTRYGVTSTPVREALNQLAVEGFVLRRAQRGFYVAEANNAELEELTNTRCWVESIALREAIGHRTTAWEETLVLAFHRLSRTRRSISDEVFRDNPDWEEAHRAFHRALLATCPSRQLIAFCARLSDHAVRYRRLAMSAIYPKRDVASEHRAIMEAATEGRTEEAVERLVQHYRHTAAIIAAEQPSA